MRLRDALDEAVQAQASQIVGDPSGVSWLGFMPEQRSKMLAEIAVMPEGALDEDEQQQDVQEAWTRGSAKRSAAAR